MTLCAFVGDEPSALGFRLAGVECHVPAPEEIPDLFAQLVARARLIVLTAEAAAALDPETLRRVRAAGEPLVAVVPDLGRRRPPPDLGERIRHQLGMAE